MALTSVTSVTTPFIYLVLKSLYNLIIPSRGDRCQVPAISAGLLKSSFFHFYFALLYKQFSL